MSPDTKTDDQQEAKRGGLPEDEALDAFAAAANAATTPRRRRRATEDQEEQSAQTATGADTARQDQGTLGSEAAAQLGGTSVSEQEQERRRDELAREELAREEAQAAHDRREEERRIQQEAEARTTGAKDVVAVVPAQLPARVRETPAIIQVPDLGPAGSRPVQCTVMVSSHVRDRFAHYQLLKKTETGREPTNAIVVRRAVLSARKADSFTQLLEAVRHRQQPMDDEDFDPDGLFGAVTGRRSERGRVKDSVQQSFRPSEQELAVIDAFTVGYGFPSRSDFIDAVLDAFLPALPDKPRRRG